MRVVNSFEPKHDLLYFVLLSVPLGRESNSCKYLVFILIAYIACHHPSFYGLLLFFSIDLYHTLFNHIHHIIVTGKTDSVSNKPSHHSLI